MQKIILVLVLILSCICCVSANFSHGFWYAETASDGENCTGSVNSFTFFPTGVCENDNGSYSITLCDDKFVNFYRHCEEGCKNLSLCRAAQVEVLGCVGSQLQTCTTPKQLMGANVLTVESCQSDDGLIVGVPRGTCLQDNDNNRVFTCTPSEWTEDTYEDCSPFDSCANCKRHSQTTGRIGVFGDDNRKYECVTIS